LRCRGCVANLLLRFLWGETPGTNSLDGPFSIEEAEKRGWKLLTRRFPTRQANKVRLIDPLVPQNKVSTLEKSVPMTSAGDILAQASALHDVNLVDQPVCKMNRRFIKAALKEEKLYEKDVCGFICNDGPPPSEKWFHKSTPPTRSSSEVPASSDLPPSRKRSAADAQKSDETLSFAVVAVFL
ncbi:unnamed protein product, partial [Amoebophrya sp. A25]